MVMPALWEWKKDLRFKDDAEVWCKYDKKDNDAIEKAYNTKETTFVLSPKYKVDLKAMVQYRESDWDKQRPIRRTPLKQKEVYWTWKQDLRLTDDNPKAWTKYTAAKSKELEDAYQEDGSETEYALEKKYRIDFSEMVQYRTGDKFRQRPIKRNIPEDDDDKEEKDSDDEDKKDSDAEEEKSSESEDDGTPAKKKPKK